ncbi:MAG: hypothetical protein OHK0031_16900 [Anaerolineales bacterium]
MAKKSKPTPKKTPRRRISWMQITLVIISILVVLSMALAQMINL